jgi:hypothetical protein
MLGAPAPLLTADGGLVPMTPLRLDNARVTSNPTRRLEVDGEVFELTTRLDLPGQVDLAWLTGPNPGYGFSTRRSSGIASDEELSTQARDFLANINADTGYLD